MGLFDRVEHRLDRVINGAFARVFKAEVQPVEIAAAMRRAMDERAAVVGKGRTIVPNVFTIELEPSDHDRLTQYADVLEKELIASVEEHAESQRYQVGGPFSVRLVTKDDLETGVFRVRPGTSDRRRAPREEPRQRPRERYREPAEPSWQPPPRHTDHADGPPRPRNSPFPPEATAPAEGAVGMAGHAASAAAAAAAGTAAAARSRASEFWAPPPPARNDAPDAGPDERPDPTAEPDAAERERQRRRDLSAWPDDEGDDDATAVGRVPLPPPAAPDPASRPWIDIDGEIYPLLEAITVVGRDTTADITLDDPGISRRHCELRVTHDGPHLIIGLRDLGSTNGTFVNGERVHGHRLADGDRVTVGRLSFTVRTQRR